MGLRSHTNITMENINEYALANEYQEYLNIVKDIPEDATVQVEYYPLVVLDNQAKAAKTFTAQTTSEEISEALIASKYSSVSKRKMELLKNGFCTGLIDILTEVEQSREIDEDLAKKLGMYSLVPEDIKKKITLSSSGTGYYLGGIYHEFSK